MLEASPKGTVPVLVKGSQVIEESFEIMEWALGQNDPQGWLEGVDLDLIREADGPFKDALDRTKYHVRFEGVDPEEEWAKANAFLAKIASKLSPNLGGGTSNLTDMAILPFVRQFANIDRVRFDGEQPKALVEWLDSFLAAPLFLSIMTKYPKWEQGDEITLFPEPEV